MVAVLELATRLRRLVVLILFYRLSPQQVVEAPGLMMQPHRLVVLVAVVVVTETFRLVLVALGRLIKDLLVVTVYERPEVVVAVVVEALEE